MSWYLKVFKLYADFTGRARRKEYWMFILFNFIALVVVSLLDFLIISTVEYVPYGSLSILYAFSVMIPNLAVFVRRLHDTTHSAWWYFIAFVPLVGWIWLLVLLVSDSTPGINQFGVNPKEIKEYHQKDRTKSAALSLIIASSIWLAVIISNIIIMWVNGSFHFRTTTGIILQNLNHLIPVALLITGISLLSKNCKKQAAAYILIIAALVSLVLRIIIAIADTIFRGTLVFDISSLLEILFIIIPLALLILGLSMLRKNGKVLIDSQIAGLSLLAVGCFWILYIIYRTVIFPIMLSGMDIALSGSDILPSAATIAVPISLIVLAFSLLQDKEKIPAEDERVIAYREELKRLRAEREPKICIGFAIVNIVIGITPFISGIALFFERHVGFYAIIPFSVGLFLWGSGVYGLYVRRKHTENKPLTKNVKLIVLIGLILSCAIVAFLATMATLSVIFDW
ncbi:MAG: DUF805 domain-containing protein [Prevotellaceae bacterium]|jgi:uncharacterized membrane protein YhaH (DUF805 family)|nr:DUF805 domain-containing protein [Prevotellaceae bacterium]